MRFTAALFLKKACKEPVPFQEILPMKLTNSVSGKSENLSEVCCLQEMSIMLACFKKNEFNQSLCSKEIEGFQKCYTMNLDKKKVRKDKESAGVLTPGEKKLSHKQMNLLLKKYPTL